MNKKLLNILMMVLLVLSISFVGISNIDAATSKVTTKTKYTEYGFSGSRWVIDSKYDAYCLNRHVSGPNVGDQFNCVSQDASDIDLNILLYLLTKASTGQTFGSTKDFVLRQNAIWQYVSGEPKGTTAAKNKAKEMVNDAKANGTNYTYTPALQFSSNLTPSITPGSSYYETNAIKPSKATNITTGEYHVSVSGVTGAKILDTNNNAKSVFKTSESFKVRVPADKITKETTVTVSIYALGTKKTPYICKPTKSGIQRVGIVITNKDTSKVSLTKTFKVQPNVINVYKVDYDNDANFLANAKYQIYRGEGCVESQKVAEYPNPLPTDSKGVVSFIGLSAGTYSIKEVTPPPGYSVSSDSCKSVTNGGSVTFKNKKNSVKLYKQDQDHRNLPGATFGLYTNSTCTTRAVDATTGKVFDFANTDSNGTVTFEGMAASSAGYYLYEQTPPNGYEVLNENENCKHVNVNGTVTFTNVKVARSYLAVQKRDYYTKFGINDVMIGLYTDSNCSTNKIGEFATYNGQVKFVVDYTERTVASLYAKEMSTPAGYIPAKGKGQIECKELKLGTEDQNTVIIYNKPYGNIRLLKLDSETQKPIEGAEFTLLDENNNPAKDADGNEVQAKKTDENGVLEFKNILYGTYFIKETASDGMHKIQKKTIKIVLNSNNDAVKLETTSTATYRLGDVNGDSAVNEEDLTIFQSIANDPDLRFGLSPEASYALDINGDGNTQASDIQKDMKILEYYLRIVNSSDSSVLDAARQYQENRDTLCDLVGDDECDTSNINAILDMYNNNTSAISSYETAQNAANQQAEQQNAHARELYDEEMAAYNAACPDGVNTMVDDGSNTGGEPSVTPTAMVPKPECQSVPQIETFTPDNVCPNYTNQILGDINHDCRVDNNDVNAADGSNIDLNGDGTSNAIDKRILTNYVNYLSGSNSSSIAQTMNSLVTNQTTLCTALGDDNCSINNSQLSDALSKVGKSGTLPANVSKASIVVTNQPIYLKISKQSITNSKEIPGAKIVIRDSKGNKILEYTSTKKPKKFKLGIGRYTLTEKVAPKGYKTLTTVVTFEVLEDGTTKLVGAASSYYKIKNSNHLIIYNELNDNIVIPDTGSNIAIASVIVGVVLVVGGGYLIYKKMS